MFKRFFALLVALLAVCAAHPVFAAANLAPTGPATVQPGQTFEVVVRATGVTDVDTVRLNGSFSQDLLEWKGASPAGMFQNISPGTFTDQSNGTFSFGTFTLNGTATGDAPVAIITFQAKKAGTALINLAANSRVLSAGEEQVGSIGGLKIVIAGAVIAPQPITPAVQAPKAAIQISSSSHPNPDAWYATSTVHISWQTTKPVRQAFTGFDQSPAGSALNAVTGNSATFIATADGVWYVHIRVVFQDGSSETANFRIKIDRGVPMIVVPITDQTGVSQGIPNNLHFGAFDSVSGISHYDIYFNGEFVTSTTDTVFNVSNLPSSTYNVRVVAIDRAGNSSEGTTQFTVIAAGGAAAAIIGVFTGYPQLSNSVLAVGVLIGLSLILLIVSRKRRKEAKKRQ